MAIRKGGARRGQDESLRSGMAYSKLLSDIMSDIESGRLSVGDRIASEVMLRDRYGISITSIKRGLGQLVEQGILTRRRGSGTFVARRKETQAAPVVRTADTIAVLRVWEQWRYHPYFAEVNKGVQDGLSSAGWRIYEHGRAVPRGQDGVSAEHTMRHWGVDRLDSELSARGDIAGIMVCSGMSEQLYGAISDRWPYVAIGGPFPASWTWGVPVGYNWHNEQRRLLAEAIVSGARRIGLCGPLGEAELESLVMEAARMVNVDRAAISVFATSQNTNTLPQSKIMGIAFDRISALLSQRAGDLDCILAMDDFWAAGALDALLALPQERTIPFYAMLNKESELPGRYPLTAMVVDGYRLGRRAAEALDDRLRRPQTAGNRVELHADMVVWR